MKTRSGICVLTHLGLGDAIICNAIFRHYAATAELVCIPVKYHNVPSVTFMLRDLPNVVIRPVEDDEEALLFYQKIWTGEKVGIGFYGANFKGAEWDKEFFSQVGISFQRRWDDWRCDRDEGLENQIDWPTWGSGWPHESLAFVHDDVNRGMRINDTWIKTSRFTMPSGFNHDFPAPFRPDPTRARPMFAYQKIIERAIEIHCICSSFSLFIDSIDLPLKPNLFLHAYLRPGEPLPTYRHNWKIITQELV